MILDTVKIREIMLQKQLTQTDIARKMRISRQAVNDQLLRGTCNINRAHRYADILGVPVMDIVNDKPPAKKALESLLADFNAQTRDLIIKVNYIIERVDKSDL